MTEIYLGNPPEHIKNWIIAHSKPQLTELCFTAEAANSSVKLQKQGSIAIEGFNGLEYKKVSATQLLAAGSDEWKPYTLGTFGQNNELSGLNAGDKVYMRAVAAGNSRMAISDSSYYNFITTGKIAASGNINTLLNPDPEYEVSLAGKDFCYSNLFYNCKYLTQAPVLPATTLANYCYYEMFSNCTSLEKAPELPAKTLTDGCYEGMFNYCSALKVAPTLHATTLANGCYMNMFIRCSSLTQAPALPATTLADWCYSYMFQSCTSLEKAPELKAETLKEGCYESMFYNCTSLKVAPELPATTLATECYYRMFASCKSLEQAPELPATTLAKDCYHVMFSDCTKFSEVHMKSSMNGVYNTSTHGNTTKTVVYDL